MEVEHEAMVDRYKMSMLRWMCGTGISLNDSKKSTEIRELLGLEPVRLSIRRSRVR